MTDRRNILYIDTSDNKKIKVAIVTAGERKEKEKICDNWTSQYLLPVIDELLGENGLKVSNISGIEVNTGPGSYTGLRVGIAVANAIGNLLDIPVNGGREIAEPVY